MSNKQTTVNGGCGCFTLILFILLLAALCGALTTTWGTLNIDIFPPGIYLDK